MARSAHVLLPLLLTLSGCLELRGCGTAAPEAGPAPLSTPSASERAPAAPAPAEAPAVVNPPSGRTPPPELRYARRWLVILHSSATPGEGGEVLAALGRTGLPAEPQRLSTNAFQQLRPCLEVVVARAFEARAEAVDFQRRLVAAGVEAYVKNAGPLEPDREGREAACRAGSEALATRLQGQGQRSVPRFVESHLGRTFLLLGESSENRTLEPMDAHASVWMAPVEADPTGLFTLGDKVDLYGVEGPLQAGCAVKGFAWINRGVAHFGYFQQQRPPEAPGCGRAWAFAELDCEVSPDTRVFALPAGTRAPVFFTFGAPLPTEEVAAQRQALQRTPRFLALRSEGAEHAERVQEALSEEVRSFGFSEGARQAVFTVAHFRTGEGNAVCGMDYDQQVTRAVVREPDREERLLAASGLEGDAVEGVLDLEGDGRLELLLHESWPVDTVRLVREDGSEVAGAVVENCDCGC